MSGSDLSSAELATFELATALVDEALSVFDDIVDPWVLDEVGDGLFWQLISTRDGAACLEANAGVQRGQGGSAVDEQGKASGALRRSLTASERLRTAALLPTVKHLAQGVARRSPSVSRDELEAVGSEAILLATLRYDASLGAFETYVFAIAHLQMRNYAFKTMRNWGRERPMADPLFRAGAAVEASADEDDAEPVWRMAESERESSGDTMRREKVGFADVVEDAESELLDGWQMAHGQQVLEKTVDAMGQPDRMVFERIYRDEWTLDSVAQELGVSKRTVQRIGDRVRATIDEAIRAARVG